MAQQEPEDVEKSGEEPQIPFAETAKDLSENFEEALDRTQANTPIPEAAYATAEEKEPSELLPEEAPTPPTQSRKDDKEVTSRPYREDSRGFPRARTTFDDLIESNEYRDQKRRRIAREQIKEDRRKHRLRILRMILYTVITLESLIFGGYLIFLILLSGIISSTDIMPWNYLPLSTTFQFDEFAVSSNSEACNEEARTLYIEGHSLYGIAFAMMICLMKHAPHRGGLGGASVAVFADAKKNYCMQTQGYPRFPEAIGKMEKDMDEDIFGISSALRPGEHDTLMAFLQKIKKDERRRLINKLLSKRARKFAVDADLARHLRTMDIMLALVPNYEFLLDHRFRGLEEGDIAEMPRSFVDDQSWINETFKYETLFPRLGQIFNEIDSKRKSTQWVPATLLQSSMHKICLPSAPPSSSVIKAAVGRIAKEHEMHFLDEAAKIAHLYKTAHDIIGSTIEDAKQHSTLPSNSPIPEKKQRSIPTTPYVANFFALVDVKKKQAVAYTSTTGTSFGSLINNSSQPSIILNNLFDYALNMYDRVGTINAFLFQPIIAFDKKIEFAWAGPGGFLQRSLDVPRLITSLIFHFHSNSSLHAATTAPLIFPSPLNFSQYTSGFQWETLNVLRSHAANYWKTLHGEPAKPMTKRGTRFARIDSGAVVEAHGTGYAPFYFNDNEDRIMPSGV